VGYSIKARPYFCEFLGEYVSVDTLLVRRTTGEKASAADVPVKDKGRVTGILGAWIYLVPFSEEALKTPGRLQGMIFHALDETGITSTHFRSEQFSEDPAVQGGPAPANAAVVMPARQERMVRYEFNKESRKVVYAIPP
jgi:hypothetical protein